MTPELIQWGIYAGLLVGGYLLRHYGVNVPLLPQAPPAPAVPSVPLPNVSAAKFPLLHSLLAQLGDDAEKIVLPTVLQALQAKGLPVAPK